MEFVEITKNGIAGIATVPITALPHWQGYGWRLVQPSEPAKPEPAPEVKANPALATQHKPLRRVPAVTEPAKD